MPTTILAMGTPPARGDGYARLGGNRAAAPRRLPARGRRSGRPAHPRRRPDRGWPAAPGLLAAARVAGAVSGYTRRFARARVGPPSGWQTHEHRLLPGPGTPHHRLPVP